MVDMDGYSNFSMQPADGQDLVAGICHARDENVELPQQWLIYVTVGDLEGSLRSCRECGGDRRFESVCRLFYNFIWQQSESGLFKAAA
jgi:predicted enzyme related to lactoylglutathione lyase